MALVVSSLSVDGRSYPWQIGSGSANISGSSGILVAYGTAYWDGSGTTGTTAGRNAAYVYGKQHANAGEQPPTTLAVSAGQVIYLQYVSGTVNTQASGATSCGPAGVATTGVTPYPAGGDDNETLPTNVIQGYSKTNGNGTVNTSGTAVTWVSGTKFSNGMYPGSPFWINNVKFTISVVNSTTSLTLTATAGTQTGVGYFYWGAQTNIGGLVGAFTDSSGNIVQTFDWASWGGVNPVTFSITTVTAASSGTTGYNGTITGGSSNAFVGYLFTVSGFSKSANNGTFMCTGSSAATLTLLNTAGLTDTTGSAAQISYIVLRVPVGATVLSLGNNDTLLWDNTGSFSLTATVTDADLYGGSINPFAHYPMSVGGFAQMGGADNFANFKKTIYMGNVTTGQLKGTRWAPDWQGQLFPRGKN